ncbi:hypothetical protein HW452_05210 [Halomonas aquamarina]|uniref:Uncharacterized protein n=1 Tax=Vreelandella aquamarina TaxID=77097 RepID=A0ACC5VRR2_9GAMM|nr:hypothetical protein [Halomonas aquamarina]MBZ5486920.1 hypothetical protein [Halomonas aquamarina]
MKRLFRCYRMPLWFFVIMLVGFTVAVTGWSAAHERRLEHRDFYLNRIAQQQQVIDQAQRVSVGLMAANAIIMGSYRWEAERAGKFENQRNVANGRLGPLQRRINELERKAEQCPGGFGESHSTD